MWDGIIVYLMGKILLTLGKFRIKNRNVKENQTDNINIYVLSINLCLFGSISSICNIQENLLELL